MSRAQHRKAGWTLPFISVCPRYIEICRRIKKCLSEQSKRLTSIDDGDAGEVRRPFDSRLVVWVSDELSIVVSVESCQTQNGFECILFEYILEYWCADKISAGLLDRYG